MRWNRDTDLFILTRLELGDLLLFSLAWMFVPENKRPIGYGEYHKTILAAASRLLLKYLKYSKICKKCGALQIDLGRKYGKITCLCGNPKLREAVSKSKRFR